MKWHGKRAKLPRYKEHARRIRWRKALLNQQPPANVEAYELKPTYNRYGMRVHRTFGVCGVPSPGHPGLWPILGGGGFFDREVGQRIVLGDWKTAEKYSTINIRPDHRAARRRRHTLSHAVDRLRAKLVGGAPP